MNAAILLEQLTSQYFATNRADVGISWTIFALLLLENNVGARVHLCVFNISQSKPVLTIYLISSSYLNLS